MEIESFHRLVLAEAMQRHNEIVDAASAEYATAKSRLDCAETQLQRARANRQAFIDFCNAHRPRESGNG